jgi:NAD(P)-dependent dehydrogenase (short-subunit alcohol dehydrogenase family)
VKSENLRFDGEVAVVTGGGRGMGRTHALDLAARGARVVVNDIEGAQAIVNEILVAGGEAIADTNSVATAGGASAVVEAGLAKWGRIDALVTNHTIYKFVPFDEMTVEDFDDVLDVKLRGNFFIMRAAYLAMKEGGGGRIVGVTSLAGLLGMEQQANYGAASAGVVGLVRSVALEGAQYGIKANMLNPGALNSTADEWVDTISPNIPGDVIRTNFVPDRVSPMVSVLAHRSCPVTGQILSAWGGGFGRATITFSKGWISKEPPAAEDVVDHWDQITDQTDAEDPPLDCLAFAARNMERLYGG